MGHPVHKVKAFEIEGPYRLRIEFDDGLVRSIDFGPVLEGELYRPLRNLDQFNAVSLDREVHTLSDLAAKHKELRSLPGTARDVWRRITQPEGRWYRLGWVAYIFIKRLLLFRWRIEGELMVRMEVQGTFLH